MSADRAPQPLRGVGDGPLAASHSLSSRLYRFVIAVRDGDEATVEALVLNLSRSRRLFAPLALVVGGVVMVFSGLKVLFSNWRLLVIQALPAMIVWWAIYDLKAHVIYGRSLPQLTGPLLIVVAAAIALITIGSFFLNAVFAFAILQPGTPRVGPAVTEARRHLGVILGSGTVVGVMLGLSATLVGREHKQWFALAMGISTGLLMLCYVAVPSRLVGARPVPSSRDRLLASGVAGLVGAIVCTPPYLLGRLGIVMLGVHLLFLPGLFVIAFAAAVQAGATGAVKTVKMSVKLLAAPPAAGAGEAAAPAPEDAREPAAPGRVADDAREPARTVAQPSAGGCARTPSDPQREVEP